MGRGQGARVGGAAAEAGEVPVPAPEPHGRRPSWGAQWRKAPPRHGSGGERRDAGAGGWICHGFIERCGEGSRLACSPWGCLHPPGIGPPARRCSGSGARAACRWQPAAGGDAERGGGGGCQQRRCSCSCPAIRPPPASFPPGPPPIRFGGGSRLQREVQAQQMPPVHPQRSAPPQGPTARPWCPAPTRRCGTPR
jgi:hypothetical protein